MYPVVANRSPRGWGSRAVLSSLPCYLSLRKTFPIRDGRRGLWDQGRGGGTPSISKHTFQHW